jgi:hypothetical protein
MLLRNLAAEPVRCAQLLLILARGSTKKSPKGDLIVVTPRCIISNTLLEEAVEVVKDLMRVFDNEMQLAYTN